MLLILKGGQERNPVVMGQELHGEGCIEDDEANKCMQTV